MKSLSTALTTIRRSPYQSMAAILVVSITFFVAYSFSLLIMGTEQILRYFETRPQIIAFFKIDAAPTTIESAANTMKAKPYVTNVSIVSKDEALKMYQETNKKDPLLLELVTADILPASIEVSGSTVDSLPQIKTDLESLSGIDDVKYQQSIVDKLKTWTTSLRLVGIVSIATLAITTFLIITVITGLKIRNQRGAIQIMRMIGASKSYVQMPFVLEAILYGVIGSLIGWGLMYSGLLYITPWITAFLDPIAVLPVPVAVLGLQLAIGTLASCILTSLASFSALSRVMKL